MAIAHSKNEQGEYHDLEAHLREVAEQCATFAQPLHAEMLGYYIGLWHDVGKYRARWQQYLLAVEANPKLKGTGGDHKAAGTQIAREQRLGAAPLLIQGHHGGLHTLAELDAWLQSHAMDIEEPIDTAQAELPDLRPATLIPLPPFLTHPHAAEFFFRLLFGALVDADFLSTERHGNFARADLRAIPVALDDLWSRFEQAQRERMEKAEATLVNRLRSEMYAACIAAAAHPPGLFRLAIPTGGGKTLSGMGFALAHAQRYGQRRVIVAIPFISITTQTAEVYRDIFESTPTTITPAVLEHHSAIDTDDSDEYNPARQWQRLAAENWDAPIIVTTTVQLFESMFNNKVSRCRKLHRLANSVIILDEAQQLPPKLLQTILDGLQELCRHYNTTVVLSTATQPAFETIAPFRNLPARDIIPDPAPYFRALERVDYDQSRLAAPQSWQSLADLMLEERQALTIVNVKRHAATLLEALGNVPHRYHLSTALCGAHRREVLKTVRNRLKTASPCLLVSTQVIEAGVDIDFPVVLRALAPLDSMVQAAGRCNREGKLTENGEPIKGQIILFQSEDGAIPQGDIYKQATNLAGNLLAFFGDDRPDDPALLHDYFAQLYQGVDTDARKIQPFREALDYPETADRFEMIPDRTISVIITTYGTEEEQQNIQTWLTELRNEWGSPRLLLRKLQPYMVTLYLSKARELEKQGLWQPVSASLPNVGVWYGKYDPLFGLVEDDVDQDKLIF